MSILLEDHLPVVKYNGLNTNKNVVLGGSSNFDMSGSTGSFKTPSGAATLNGTTTIGGALTVQSPTPSARLNVSNSTGSQTAVSIYNVNSDTTVSGNIDFNRGLTLAGSILATSTNNLLLNSAQYVDLANAGSTIMRVAASVTVAQSTALTAGGAVALGLGTNNVLGIYFGSGLPTINAPVGSLYLRSDGSSVSTRMYVSTGVSTWTNVTTAT